MADMALCNHKNASPEKRSRGILWRQGDICVLVSNMIVQKVPGSVKETPDYPRQLQACIHEHWACIHLTKPSRQSYFQSFRIYSVFSLQSHWFFLILEIAHSKHETVIPGHHSSWKKGIIKPCGSSTLRYANGASQYNSIYSINLLISDGG